MDERRQPDSGPGQSEWRVNGAHGPAGLREDHSWPGIGAAARPSPEPLALLADGPEGGQGRHREPYRPGLDDPTPASGVPVIEPPLWREATRHSYRSGGYDPPFGEHGSAPAGELGDRPAGPAGPDPTGFAGLPQRVPAEPDVPVVPEPEPDDRLPPEPATARDRWTAPELAFIADQLRRDDVPDETLTGSFDVDAVVAAVREVPGVEAASVRTNPTGMHTLRLDLADDADPGQVSRAVARLLLERMGLSASPQDVPQTRGADPPPTVDPGFRQPAAAPDLGDTPDLVGAPGLLDGDLDLAAAPDPLAVADPLAADPLGVAEPLAAPGPLGAPEPLGAADPLGVAEPLSAPEPAAPAEPAATAPRFPAIPAQSRGSWEGWRYDSRDYPAGTDPDGPFTAPVTRPLPAGQSGPRVVIDQVQVRTVGLEATVEVLLTAGERQATGVGRGPAVDSYLVRLAAVAAAKAIDSLLRGVADPSGPSRCFVEHTGLVEFGNVEVAVVVLLLVCGGWVEQLTGSALVDGDPRQAVVRATLGAVNRRLEALLD